jgi:hypothetical protein
VSANNNRRVKVGPFAIFIFGSEKVVEVRMAGQARASWPPNLRGGELVATLTIEIDDPKRRERELYRLAGLGEAAYIALNQERIPATPMDNGERTMQDGKTSSVHRVRFRFIPEQIEKFRMLSVEAVLGLAHPAYSHMTVIMPDVRAELARDFG